MTKYIARIVSNPIFGAILNVIWLGLADLLIFNIPAGIAKMLIAPFALILTMTTLPVLVYELTGSILLETLAEKGLLTCYLIGASLHGYQTVAQVYGKSYLRQFNSDIENPDIT